DDVYVVVVGLIDFVVGARIGSQVRAGFDLCRIKVQCPFDGKGSGGGELLHVVRVVVGDKDAVLVRIVVDGVGCFSARGHGGDDLPAGFGDDCDGASVCFCNEDIGVAEGNAIPARYLGYNRFHTVGGRVDDDKVIVRTLGNVSGVCSRVDDNLVAVASDTGEGDRFLGGDVHLRCGRLAGGRGWGSGGRGAAGCEESGGGDCHYPCDGFEPRTEASRVVGHHTAHWREVGVPNPRGHQDASH